MKFRFVPLAPRSPLTSLALHTKTQWLDFSPKCPTCKTLSSIHDVVPIYRGDLGLSSGPSSPELASTSSRSSISFSQRLLSPPPNHLLRPLPDDSQVAPSAFFPWSWASAGRDEQPPQQQARSASKSRSWRRSAFTTSTSSPASSVHPELASPNLTATSTRNNTLLAPPPPRFRFTLEDDDPTAVAASGIVPPGHRNAEQQLQEEWDTDDEMEFQLNQIASIKMPQTITDAVNGVSDAVNGGVAATGEVYQGQPVRRALSVVGLAIFLTVLLK